MCLQQGYIDFEILHGRLELVNLEGSPISRSELNSISVTKYQDQDVLSRQCGRTPISCDLAFAYLIQISLLDSVNRI